MSIARETGMEERSIAPWRHEHVFLGVDHARNARKTRVVMVLCGVTMAVEIVGGALFHSLAVVADGVHMGTHVSALAIAAFAYGYASRHARDERFAFGTGKVGDLAAFASAIVLAIVALGVAGDSIVHLLRPPTIAFREAIPIAGLGLAVNLVSAFLLRDDHDRHHHEHAHGHGHDHAHDREHRDLNLRAAYIHVTADAGVSVLALLGLTAGLLFSWVWMDAVMGLMGAAVIANWAWGLVRAAGAVLLDRRPESGLYADVLARLEAEGDRVADFHLWRVGPGHMAAAITLVSQEPRAPDYYRRRLAGLGGLSHVTIEVAPAAVDGRDAA